MRKSTYSTYGFYSQRIGGAPKDGSFKFDGWGKGVNVFAEHNEIKNDEFVEGENVMIVGKGSIQMPRYGSELLVSKPGASKCNGGYIYKNEETGEETPVFMFDGRLYKYTSGSLTQIDSSKTWNTTARVNFVQYKNQLYFGNGIDPLSKTDLSTIVQFSEISDPTSITVTKTGSKSEYIYRYAFTVVTDYGETSYTVSGDNWGPATLDANNYFTVSTPRNSDSKVIGYNLYRSINGSDLYYLAFIPQPASGNPSFKDDGAFEQSTIYVAPDFNTTGGVKGKYYATFKETLFVAGVPEQPSYLFYTGTGVNYESFSPDGNGGWVRINQGDGTRITAIKGFDVYLLIIKERSIYRFDFAQGSGAPQVYIVEPLYGSPYSNSVEKFEKDLIMIGSDNSIRTIGYEPTLLNVIRTKSISNRVQPVFDSEFDFSSPDDVIGVYYKNKYIVCDGKIAVVYDYQYTGFHGTKWTNYNYALFLIWEKNGKQYLLGATHDGKVNKLLVEGIYTDNNQPIRAVFRPKTIDGGEDGLVKFYHYFKIKLKNFTGSLTLEVWKDGVTTADTKTLTIGGSTGISYFMWGQPMWGEASEEDTSSEFERLGTTVLLTKELYFEAYYIYFRLIVNGSEDNHCLVQSSYGTFEYEDIDYHREENILRIDI